MVTGVEAFLCSRDNLLASTRYSLPVPAMRTRTTHKLYPAVPEYRASARGMALGPGTSYSGSRYDTAHTGLPRCNTLALE